MVLCGIGYWVLGIEIGHDISPLPDMVLVNVLCRYRYIIVLIYMGTTINTIISKASIGSTL